MTVDRASEEVSYVDMEEAEYKRQNGQAIFVDVRPRIAYDYSHIRGAVSLPLALIAARPHVLPRDQELVLYANTHEDPAARKAARFLIEKGYLQVKALRGGIRAWEGAGYPVGTEFTPGEGIADEARYRQELGQY